MPRIPRISTAISVAACLFPAVTSQAAVFVLSAGAAISAPVNDASPSPLPAAKLSLSPSTGSAGTPVVISGSGFPPGEIVAIYVDAAGPYLAYPPPGPRSDGQGTVRVSVIWPGKNYDPSDHVDPTIVGPHTVCGDTAYPGSTQRVPARGCAQFVVVAVRSTPTASAARAASDTGVPAGEVLVAFVALMILAGGVLLITRRSR
jgi:hypothetical protein